MANYGQAVGSVIGATIVVDAVSRIAKKGKKLVTIQKPKANKTLKELNKLI